MKSKTCPICRIKFVPSRQMQKVCSPACAYEYSRKQAAKAETRKALEDRKTIKIRKDAIKIRKDAIKTIRDWTKEAQIAFNAYIRERDRNKPCICCGRPLADSAVGGGFDCGHYRSVGSAPHLRFDERNAHGQTKQCNRYGAGRAVDYRIGLIQRIGLEQVESLESNQAPKKYSIEDLKAIKDEYKRKLKELRNAKH